mgnify:FL=1
MSPELVARDGHTPGFPRVSGDEPYRKPHNGYHLKRLSFGAQFNTRPGLSASDAYPHAEAGTVRLRVGEPPPPVHPAGSACRRQRGCQPCRRPCEPAASAREPKVRESKEGVAWPGGVDEPGVEGADGVGVTDGVGTVEGVGVTGGVSVGGFHYMKPSGGVSSACRIPVSCNSP